MFKQAIEKLEKELRSLEKEYRHELPKEIKRALAMGDLRENAEYHAALERQSVVKAKIGHIKKRLSEISMIKVDSLPRDRVALGSTVKLYDLEGDKEIKYQLVFADDADAARGLISITSPIGRGLSGHKVGDEVSIQVPSGVRRFEIVSLQTVHEKQSPGAVPGGGDEEE
jgi:transcription elongation factor GreA